MYAGEWLIDGLAWHTYTYPLMIDRVIGVTESYCLFLMGTLGHAGALVECIGSIFPEV